MEDWFSGDNQVNGVRDAVGIFITLPMLLLCSWAQVIPTQPLVNPFTEGILHHLNIKSLIIMDSHFIHYQIPHL